MTRWVPSNGRQRARSRGRRRILIGVAVLAAAVGVGLAFYPYPPLPTADVEAARAALQNARRESGKLAPEPLAKTTAAAIMMERLYAADRSRYFRFTRLESLDRAISDTRSFAAQTVIEARQVRVARLKDGQDQRSQIEADLALVAPDIEFLPPRESGARRAYQRAHLALAQAASAQSGGDLGLLDASLKTARLELDLTHKMLGKRYERFNNPEWRRRWQRWADDTVAASHGGVAILIEKIGRRLCLLRDGRVVAEFDADLGRNALSGKVSAGDGATPEGRYHIKEKRANGSTRWYKALLLDYPNAEDWTAFQDLRRRGGIPRGRGPGGLIEIHGNGGKQSNWTDGCVALRDAAMDRLFAQVPVGTPVTIVGAARLPGDGGSAAGTR